MINKIPYKIYLYIISDVFSQVSYRLFQVFCTWYYIQYYNQEENLASIMFFVWLSSVLFLPISGIALEKYRKTSVLSISCFIICICSIFTLAYYHYYTNHNNYTDIVFLVISIFLSAASSFILPLGVSLIPEISSNQNETSFGIRIKSSTFIINLFLGPMLGGFLAGTLGGESILVAALIFSFLSVISSLYLSIKTNLKIVKNTQEKFIFALTEGIKRTIKIKEERIVAIISSGSNLFLVPFIFLLLPSKVISEGNTMVDISIIEVCLGIGMLLSPIVFIPYLEKSLGKHITICLGQTLIAFSIFSFSLTNNLYIQYLLGFALGIGLNLFNVIINTCRAISIPDGYRGSMESSFLLLCMITIPTGFWISKLYLNTFTANDIISSSIIIYIPSLLIVIMSTSIKNIVGSSSENQPYYKTKYKKLFV
ncbi:MFS transporter [Vibrio spartinae]|uniref:Major Facilitator Superfamily protein n=1 Tax=Vibrio spartinae TaxID=1918945 RepID=A0A1N6M911_9VIBR|nr:MFS transporter [Vibrio spartinae]SIO95933.1 Major Facilitator Superfamily protein [Vibrio spartinae]